MSSSSEEQLSTEGQLREQVRQLLDETTELKRTIEKQQEEIKRLKELLQIDVADTTRQPTKRKRSSSSKGPTRQALSMTLPSPVGEKKNSTPAPGL